MTNRSKNDIVFITAQDLASLFQSKQSDSNSLVAWIRTTDFKTQLYLDKNFETIWQRDSQLVINNPFIFNEFLLNEDHEDMVTQISARNEKYESGQVIFRITRPDGEMRWIKDTSYYLFDKNNSAFAVVGIAESISPDQWHSIRQRQKHPHFLANENSPFEKALVDLLKNSTRFISKRDNKDLLTTNPAEPRFIIEENDRQIKLSKREKDCLACLLRGLTAKETAKVLGISHRTVEDYLENMKIKTKSANKFELLSKLKILSSP